MTNNETRRLQERLLDEIGSRMDRYERKLDSFGEKCVGCARELATATEKNRSNEAALTEHKRDHQWHAGRIASITGVIVAILSFVGSLFWRK